MAQRRLDKATKALKGDKKMQTEVDFLKRLIAHLENGLPARSVEITDETEQEIIDTTALLSAKPVIYACNMSEEDFADIDGMFESVMKTFGIVAVGRAAVCEKNIEDIKNSNRRDFRF